MLLPWAHGLGTECPAIYLEDLFGAQARDFSMGPQFLQGEERMGPGHFRGVSGRRGLQLPLAPVSSQLRLHPLP